MSQVEVMITLKELGGRATNKILVKRISEKYPGLTLNEYVGCRLTKLRKAGYVGYNKDTMEWYIIDSSIIEERNMIQI